MAGADISFARRLMEAADALTGTGATPVAADLLRYLGYDDGDAAATAGRARMLRAGARFSRLFRLPAPDAPGLTFLGAEADPACLGPHNIGLPVGGVAGSGLDARRAFESCVGEGIEYLSQFAQPDDALAAGQIDTFAESLDPGAIEFLRRVWSACDLKLGRTVDWISVLRIADGVAVRFPVDLCLRRSAPDFVAPLKLSTGCAAGATRADATLRGLLELIERDAVAMWWRGGRRGRTIAASSEAGLAATGLLTKIRRGRDERRTALLDITSELGVPVVAAFSVRPDGNGFALGMSARTSLAEAAGSAIFELCQSELSLHVIAAKRRESGEAGLNADDRRQSARAAMLDPRRCVLLQPYDAAPATYADLSGDPAAAIVRLLEKHGIVAHALDLTRAGFGVPVVRVIAPGLQLEPCDIIGNRLADAISETGGGAEHSGGVALL